MASSALPALPQPVTSITERDAIALYPEIYKQLVTVPYVTGAQFVRPASRNVTLSTGQRDIDQDAFLTFTAPYVWDPAQEKYTCASSFPIETSGIAASLPSPSGKLLAVLRKGKPKKPGGDDKDLFCFEIFSENRVVAAVTTEGVHGRVYASATLGGFSWHPDETALAYIAEAKATTTLAFWDKDDIPDKPDTKDTGSSASGASAAGKDAAASAKIRGAKYEYTEDLGEEYDKCVLPRPFILDLVQKKIKPIAQVPRNCHIGQVIWCPDGSGIVYTAWPNAPRSLGLTHYNTRSSKLYHLVVKQQAIEGLSVPSDAQPTLLTPDDHSAMCPRFSLDGQKLAFLSTDAVWYHNACARLRVLSWADKSIRTVVDVVQNVSSPDDFPGLWPAAGALGVLPPQIWLGDHTHVVFSSQWRSRESLIIINTSSGRVHRVESPVPNGSVALLDVLGSNVLVAASNVNTPSAVFFLDAIKYIQSSTSKSAVSAAAAPAPLPQGQIAGPAAGWIPVCTPPLLQSHPQDSIQAHIKKVYETTLFEVTQITPPNTANTFPNLPFESILIYPSTASAANPVPLIVFPHGGPHSSDSTLHWPGVMFLQAIGHAVLLINYRGSRGFGEAFLEALPGRCGTLDVQDVVQATDLALARGIFDRQKLSVFGGSHGGFLVTHLIGQHPDLFKAAATRNPVTNIAHMAASTDIPDWCYVECGLPYSLDHLPTPEEYATMFRLSPILHARNVKTPLLLQLGDADRRVPMAQAVDYYKILKAQGVITRLLVYPNNRHSLRDSVGSESDTWVNSALWLMGFFTVPSLAPVPPTPAQTIAPTVEAVSSVAAAAAASAL